MRVWTFQPTAVTQLIRAQVRFTVAWHRAPRNWEPAYRWMARQMVRVGIPVGPNAPIWCWQRCAPRGGPPTLGTARALLSDSKLENPFSVLELEVPEEFVLLSSYIDWNEALDFTIDTGSEPPDTHESMFDPVTDPDDDTQACIPFILESWIVASRPLRLFEASLDTQWDEPV